MDHMSFLALFVYDPKIFSPFGNELIKEAKEQANMQYMKMQT